MDFATLTSVQHVAANFSPYISVSSSLFHPGWIIFFLKRFDLPRGARFCDEMLCSV